MIQGEGSVIYDSAVALTQGMFPAMPNQIMQLANGTNITSPLNGYQYVGINSIGEDEISLEGWTECPAFMQATEDFYNSQSFKQKASENSQFLQDIVPLVGGRNVTLQNMWNIYDYMNVNFIHNATFMRNVSAQQMEQARALANYHEYSVFSSSDSASVQNIGGQSVLPLILNALNSFTNTSQTVRYQSLHISYKPFISLFQMTNASVSDPTLQGIVNYAASMAFELHQPADRSEPYVTLVFKNGTDDAAYRNLAMFNASTVTLNAFQSALSPYAIDDLGEWCSKCGNSASRGCDVLSLANQTWSNDNMARGQSLSPLSAGFLGAGLTLFILGSVICAMLFFGSLVWRPRSGVRKSYVRPFSFCPTENIHPLF